MLGYIQWPWAQPATVPGLRARRQRETHTERGSERREREREREGDRWGCRQVRHRGPWHTGAEDLASQGLLTLQRKRRGAGRGEGREGQGESGGSFGGAPGELSRGGSRGSCRGSRLGSLPCVSRCHGACVKVRPGSLGRGEGAWGLPGEPPWEWLGRVLGAPWGRPEGGEENCKNQ